MKEFTHQQIGELLWAVARGASVRSLMKKHELTRAQLRRWQDTYGMPIVENGPTAKQLSALRAWRKATSREKAWQRYHRAAEALDHSEVPPNPTPSVARYEYVDVHGWVAARVLLICEKKMVVSTLEEWRSPKEPSFSYAHRTLLATTAWLPSRRGVDALMMHARKPRIPAAFFGDLDPQAIHSFATLRAGGQKELLRSKRARHAVGYIGLDSTWLEWLERRANGFLPYTIKLRDVDREYWEIIQRLVPDARRLIGPIASEFLDGGQKIEVDGIVIRHRDAFLRELGRRLRHP